MQVTTNIKVGQVSGSVVLLAKRKFNPRTLFSSNEQGLWLDPSDMTATKAGWRRNLLTYSEQLDNSVWSKDLSSISANASTSPDGTTTADKLIPDNTSGVHRLRLLVSSTTSFSHTVSFYAKASEISKICFREGNTTGAYAAFDLSNGTIIHQGQGGTGAVISVGSGWYRCSVSFTAGASARIDIIALPNSYTSSNSPIENFTFNGTDGFLLWGIQYEQSSSPSEYQRITDFSTEFKAAFPTHTLYQDSNGVTPCTDSGQPVGLILDQSLGGLGALGSELLADSGFDNAGSWDASAGVTVSGGVAAWNTAGLSVYVRQENIITQNRWYLVEIDCSSYTSGEVRFAYTSGATSFSSPGMTVNKTGLVRFMFFSSAGGGRAWLLTPSGGAVLSVTRFSIREVPGNHAYQTTSASRPTLARIPSSGRRNVLTFTEQLDNAAWTKSVATATANTHTAFDGTTTADTLEDTGSGGYGVVSQSYTFLNVAYTFAIDIRKTSGTPASFPGIQCGPASIFHIIHTTNGTVSSTAGGQTCTVTSLDSNWWRVVVNFTPTAGADRVAIFPAISSDSTTLSTAAVGTVIVSRAQLELGSTATNYQRVGSTHDVSESGFSDLYHLSFDGADDFLTAGDVCDIGSNSSMIVVGGSISGAGGSLIAKSRLAAGDGRFWLVRDTSITTAAYTNASGNNTASFSHTTSSALVYSSYVDRAAGTLVLRVNASQQAAATPWTPETTSHDTTNRLLIGAYSNASDTGQVLHLNGAIFQVIIRQSATPTGKLLEAERFVARKTGVSF